MLGTSLHFAKSNGNGRFYNSGPAAASPEKIPVPEEPAKSATSNLDRFLESTTPSVPAHYYSKMTRRGWRGCDVEDRPYFLLADLWESFKEWSAYGAGVPLVVDGGDCFVQYYVPYLSGIQLYGHSPAGPDSSRNAWQMEYENGGEKVVSYCHTWKEADLSPSFHMAVAKLTLRVMKLQEPKDTIVPLGEDSDSDFCRDSSSDGSSECELDRGLIYAREWDLNHLVHTSTLGMDELFSRENHVAFHEGFSSNDSDSRSSQEHLLFEYLERDPPYGREPLADKISDLARSFPELKTSRSCDLLPASWISVAWYPIYRIPTGPTLKDLDACFLTFHSLSTPMTGAATGFPIVSYLHGNDSVPKISLRSFGLASYKLQGSLWTPTGGGCGRQLAISLLQAADNWLRLLNVDHPDYRFFASRGAFRR